MAFLLRKKESMTVTLTNSGLFVKYHFEIKSKLILNQQELDPFHTYYLLLNIQ